jgi:hypothetical protein
MKSSLTTPVLAAILLVAVYAYGADQRRQGAQAERYKAVRASERVAVETVTVREVRYRRDTIHFRSVLTRYDSTRVTDTLVVTRHDTAVVFIERAVADSAVAACLRVVRSCESSVAGLRALVAAKDSVIVSMPKPPSQLRVWGERAILAKLFYELGKAAGR